MKSSNQKGFTLIELGVVVLILGIIGAFLVPRFTSGGTSKARATAIDTFASNSADLMRNAIQQLGSSYAIAGNDANDNNIMPTGVDWLDLLIYGERVDPDVDTTFLTKQEYESRYRTTGNAALESSVDVQIAATGGAAPANGEYEVQGFPVGISDNGIADASGRANVNDCNVVAAVGGLTRDVWFTFDDVEPEVVEALILRIDQQFIFDPGTAEDASNLRDIAWSAQNADGLHTVCIRKSLR